MRHYWIIGLLLVAGAAIALTDLGADDPWIAPARDGGVENDDPTLIAGASHDDPGTPAAPTLEVRATSDDGHPERGRVTVQVVGPDGTGLPSMFVALGKTTAHESPSNSEVPITWQGLRKTDQAGEVVFDDVPYDGSHAVTAHSPVGDHTSGSLFRELPPAAGMRSEIPVRSERVVYRAAVGHWLSVHVVRARDGHPLPHARVRVPGALRTRNDNGGLQDGQAALVRWPVEDETTVKLEVQPPRGFVAWEPTSWQVPISPYARRLAAYYPLRTEVPVTVSVSEPDRSPTRNPVLTDARVAGRKLASSKAATDAYGRLRVHGVPFLPGELVWVNAKRAGGSAGAAASAHIPYDPDGGVHLDIVLPPEHTAPIGIGGSAGGSWGSRCGTRRTLRGTHTPPKGAVVVDVRRRGGAPAAGASVWLGRRNAHADAHGRVRFDRVAPGTYRVSARQVGLLPLSQEVTIHGVETARVELRETAGGKLLVQVVDEQDRPLPFASLSVKTASEHPWVDLDGDVQRVDPFTDHEGKRLLRGVEPGRVTLSASWGSRSRKIVVPVVADEEQAVRIVLARAKSN